MDFKGRKIILIAPKYYGYGQMIQMRLEDLGAEVYRVCQGIYEINGIYSVVYKYGRVLSASICKYYYFKKFKSLPSDIDCVFIIKGHSLTVEIMDVLKEKYPNSKFLMYQWDSAKNEPNALLLKDYFDDIFTFDSEDAERYSWKYRPLFYDSRLCHDVKKTIDLAYIATVHSERVHILHKISEIAEKNSFTLFDYLVCTGLGYIKRRYIMCDPVYVGLEWHEVHFRGLSIEDTQAVFDRAKVVIDYANPKQTGLTMRTIESIGHSCKLITNNKYIKNESFYNENNIWVYENDIEVPEKFVKSDYQQIPNEILQYYSLDGWIKTILGEIAVK